MTSKVEKSCTFTHKLITIPCLFFSSMVWNTQDIGISKTVKDTSMLPSKISATFKNQMKASQKTGSEANFRFGRVLMPSYHGKEYFFSAMSAIDSKKEEEEEEKNDRRQRRISTSFHHRKVKTIPVWPLSSCTNDIICSPSLRSSDREMDRTQNSRIADPIASSHHEITPHLSSIK